jgi:hypothetical protein
MSHLKLLSVTFAGSGVNSGAAQAPKATGFYALAENLGFGWSSAFSAALKAFVE